MYVKTCLMVFYISPMFKIHFLSYIEGKFKIIYSLQLKILNIPYMHRAKETWVDLV